MNQIPLIHFFEIISRFCDNEDGFANNRPKVSNNKRLNKSSFITILEQNKGILYKVTHSYCKDIDDQKGLIQEITIQLWNSFHRYDDQFKISTCIYRVALNVSISFYRKERTRKNHTISTGQLIDLPEVLEDQLESQIAQLYLFIQQLKPLDKALMILYLEDKSHPERVLL